MGLMIYILVIPPFPKDILLESCVASACVFKWFNSVSLVVEYGDSTFIIAWEVAGFFLEFSSLEPPLAFLSPR